MSEPITTLEYAGPRRDDEPLRPQRYYLTRVACVIAGIAYPIAGLAFNARPGDDTVPVDWQNGQPLAWLSLVTLPEVGWVQWPLLGLSWFCLILAALKPAVVARSWSARAGLWLGVAMGAEYMAIVAVGMADGVLTEMLGSAGFQTIGLAVAVVAVVAFVGLDHGLRALGRIPKSRLGWVVGGIVGGAVLIGVVTGGAALAMPIAGVFIAAPISVGGHGGMLWLLRRPAFRALDEDDVAASADRRWAWAAALVLLPLHAAGWTYMWFAAHRAYALLPTVEPDRCFVATAASRSRRSAATRHRQLRTLRVFESWLRSRRPLTHAVIRRHYNVLGPPLARRVNTPHRADAAHRLLRIIEVAAAAVLRRA